MKSITPADYGGIIRLPHHTSEKHMQMTRADRAAQFAPFAALSGYGDEIDETARLTDGRIELSEDEKELLDGKLRMLGDGICSEAAITYFVPDSRKAGGCYRTEAGEVRRIDELERTVIMRSGVKIHIDDILSIVLK